METDGNASAYCTYWADLVFGDDQVAEVDWVECSGQAWKN